MGGLVKVGAADRGFMLSSQGKASKALPEARKFRLVMDEFNDFFMGSFGLKKCAKHQIMDQRTGSQVLANQPFGQGIKIVPVGKFDRTA